MQLAHIFGCAPCFFCTIFETLTLSSVIDIIHEGKLLPFYQYFIEGDGVANIIAIIWDFDKTLINGYMEDPLLEDNGINPKDFWQETNSLPQKYALEQNVKVNPDTIYLNQLINYAKSGRLKGLNNQKLREYGKKMKFYPGVPDIFEKTRDLIENNEIYQEYDIKVEHYIISSGLSEIIRGSDVAKYVSNIWGCEFIEIESDDGKPIIGEIGYTIDNATKTRALFEINKGVGKVSGVQVNTTLPEEHRRVHFINMVYVADGPSDIPAFSVVNRNGGATFAVYPAGDMRAMKQVETMRQDNRINMFAEADYSEGKTACMWLCGKIEEFAEKIREEEKRKLIQFTNKKPPQHLI